MGEVSATSGGDYNLINLYVDPGATQPATPSLSDSGDSGEPTVNYIDFRTARFSTGDIYSVDNILIGPTYADVVPVVVPEPGTGLLLLLASACLCLGKLFRRTAPRSNSSTPL